VLLAFIEFHSMPTAIFLYAHMNGCSFYNLGNATESKDADTESLASEHSSIDAEMTVAELKDYLYLKLLEKSKVNVHGKAPSMDEVRQVMKVTKNVKAADDDFTRNAPRTVLTRF